MNRVYRSLVILCLVSGLSTTESLFGQCSVVINEIMINGPGSCDGMCNPNTEEWVELYNPCTQTIDLSCWVMGDGDFTVTFPPGTTIAPGAFFVIGSINSGPVVDLFLGSCNCTAGSSIGTYTNGNEQVLLFDSSGALQDAIYWGAGQFPCPVNAPSLFGCPPLSYLASSPGPEFEHLPTGGANGCTLARSCDGSMIWEERCGGGISMGTSNLIPPVLTIAVEDSQICTGFCTNVVYTGAGNVISATWQFPGSNVELFEGTVPPSVCYSAPGFYSVLLAITTECGTFSQSFPDQIEVLGLEAPVINGDKSIELCGDNPVELTTDAIGSLQWLLGDQVIDGATGSSFWVDSPGSYAVQLTQGDCTAISNEIQVFESPLVAPVIEPGPVASICEGEVLELAVPDVFEAYQWFLNGQPIDGATTASYVVGAPGTYAVQVTLGDCTLSTDNVIINALDDSGLEIFSEGGAAICDGESIELSATPGLSDYVWFMNGKPLDESGPVIVTTQGGFYTVQASLGECVFNSSPYNLQVFGSPFIQYFGPEEVLICAGSTHEIFMNVDTELVFWTLNGNPIPGATQPDITISEAGTYTITASFDNTCFSTFSVNASLTDPISALILSSTGAFDICAGEVITLSVEGEWTDYQWLFNTFPQSNNPTIQVAIPGLYTVFVYDVNGCEATDVIAISAQTVVQPVISPTGIIDLCFGESVILASSEPVQHWLLNGVVIPDSDVQEFTASAPGVYTAVSGFGLCALTSDPVIVSVGAPLSISISVSDDAPCSGDSVELTASGVGFDLLVWSTGETSTTISVSQEAEYSVTGVNAQQCSTTESVVVSFVPMPVAVVPSVVYNICESGVVIPAQASGGVITWFPDEGLDNPTIAQPFATPIETMVYELTVTNGDCISTAQVTVVSDCSLLTVPNIFSPNGDGVNDRFEVVTAGLLEFDLTIYNRWGDAIFTSRDPLNQWDGRWKGDEVPAGTYFYTLKAVDFTGRDVVAGGQNSGYITLVR